MQRREIEAWIRQEIAKCKAADVNSISIDDPIVETIGLHGDDFMAIAEFLHRTYGISPALDAYHVGMSIRDWASIIVAEIRTDGRDLR